jgi:hypothetical protein
LKNAQQLTPSPAETPDGEKAGRREGRTERRPDGEEAIPGFQPALSERAIVENTDD